MAYEQDGPNAAQSPTDSTLRSRRRNSNDINAGSSDPLIQYTDPPRLRSTNPLNDLRTILTSGYINVLLVFFPFAIISGALGWSPNVVFLMNFFALMPLAALLSFATEELSKTAGQAIGGLLNVTFGNATELIVGIVALRDGQVRLIQTTMLGSILSSLLFVLRCLLIIVYKLGTRIDFCSRGDADSRISVQ
jgi:Sodium/calcium exchanger protein